MTARTHPSNVPRQRKAWALARVLVAYPSILADPDVVDLSTDARRLVAKAAGVTSPRPVSDHTWKLAVVHGRQMAGAR